MVSRAELCPARARGHSRLRRVSELLVLFFPTSLYFVIQRVLEPISLAGSLMGFMMQHLLGADVVLKGGLEHWSHSGHHKPLKPAGVQDAPSAPAEPDRAKREGRKVRGQVAGKAKGQDKKYKGV